MIGLLAGLICLWGVNGLKRMLGADDSLDVFGVHGVGGIVGALLTGVFAAPSPGRHRHLRLRRQQGQPRVLDRRPGLDPVPGRADHDRLVGVVAFVAYKIVDLVIGLRVTEEEEREGLDITSHGETAYNR